MSPLSYRDRRTTFLVLDIVGMPGMRAARAQEGNFIRRVRAFERENLLTIQRERESREKSTECLMRTESIRLRDSPFTLSKVWQSLLSATCCTRRCPFCIYLYADTRQLAGQTRGPLLLKLAPESRVDSPGRESQMSRC